MTRSRATEKVDPVFCFLGVNVPKYRFHIEPYGSPSAPRTWPTTWVSVDTINWYYLGSPEAEGIVESGWPYQTLLHPSKKQN